MEQPYRRFIVFALIVTLGAGVVAGLAVRSDVERVEGHAFPVPSGEDRVVVEVLNGTSRQGLARLATRGLRRQGIDVVFVGNADAPAESTQVLVRRGEPGRGEQVARALETGIVRLSRDTLRRVDVSVILGLDYRPPVSVQP